MACHGAVHCGLKRATESSLLCTCTCSLQPKRLGLGFSEFRVYGVEVSRFRVYRFLGLGFRVFGVWGLEFRGLGLGSVLALLAIRFRIGAPGLMFPLRGGVYACLDFSTYATC